jgi:hypothetical protein
MCKNVAHRHMSRFVTSVLLGIWQHVFSYMETVVLQKGWSVRRDVEVESLTGRRRRGQDPAYDHAGVTSLFLSANLYFFVMFLFILFVFLVCYMQYPTLVHPTLSCVSTVAANIQARTSIVHK